MREDVGIADVGLVGRVVVSLVENILEALYETLLAAPEFHHTRHVVGHGKGVVPSRTFVETGAGFKVFSLKGIERSKELAIGRDGAEGAGFGAVEFLVTLCAVAQGFCIFLVAQSFGHLCQSVVGHVVFEGVADAVVVLRAQGHIGALHIVVVVGAERIFLTWGEGVLAHGLINLLGIVGAQTFEVTIHNDGQGRVALHRASLAAVEFPAGKPAKLAIDAHHGAQHILLAVGIEEGDELVRTAVSVPEGEDGVAVVVGLANLIAFHHGIFTVDVLENVGMDEEVVESRVEHAFLLLSAALHFDAREDVVPLLAGFAANLVEVLSFLFSLKVHARILGADEGNANAHLHLFALRGVEGEPCAHIVARNFLGILLIHLARALCGVPVGLVAHHRTLEFPIALLHAALLYAHDEIEREDALLVVVAEGAEEAHAFHLVVAHAAQHAARLVAEGFAEVHQHVAATLGEGEAMEGRAGRGSHLGADAVLVELATVIAGLGHLVAYHGAVLLVVDIERIACGGHQQERAEVGATYAAEVDVGEACQIDVLGGVGAGPPTLVLVVLIEVAAHHVEGRGAHQAVGTDGTGVGRAEIGCTNEWIDIVNGHLLSRCG